MSDLETSAYASGPSTTDERSKAQQVAEQGGHAAADAAVEVKETAKEQAQRVGAEVKSQARDVASDVRAKVSEQARTQNDRLVGSIRQTADHLDEMRGERPDSPAATVVSRVADGGRQLADYLDRNGPEGVLREVEDFARRRPGAFLATALVAGFVVGRLGKSVAKADSNAGTSTDKSDAGDAFSSSYPQAHPTPPPVGYGAPIPSGVDTAATTGATTGYGAPGTEYAATGTGSPLVVNDPYGDPGPGTRP